MGKETVDKIRDLLWQDSEKYNDLQVYVILDAARDKNIFIGLMNSDEEYVCLYKGGKKAKELETCAPYLVKLEKYSPFAEWILKDGWGKSWGIFCRTDAPIQKVRDHFREFVMVVNEDGDPLYFRFYDPRVMRSFLPTCNSKQLDELFGNLGEYFIEDENGKGVIQYSLTNESLSEEVVEFG
jgi:hypothetical protein